MGKNDYRVTGSKGNRKESDDHNSTANRESQQVANGAVEVFKVAVAPLRAIGWLLGKGVDAVGSGADALRSNEGGLERQQRIDYEKAKAKYEAQQRDRQ